MKTVFAIALPLIALFSLGAAAGSKAPQGKVERGRYLVERVALCVDCHTPHDQSGQPIQSQNLQGAPLPFKAAVPMPWADTAPAIAGLPTMNAEQATTFLMTGKAYRPIRPPMPPYRLNQEDAEAVVAYLKSLPPPAKQPNEPAAPGAPQPRTGPSGAPAPTPKPPQAP